LRQEFDYSKYALDHKTVWIRIWSSNFQRTHYLLPALDDYLYKLAEQNQTQLTYSQLKSSRESKSRQVENYFQRVRSQVVTLSDNLMTIDAMKAFSSAFNALKKSELKVSESKNYQNALYRYYQRRISNPGSRA
jgi:hypothetical protein